MSDDDAREALVVISLESIDDQDLIDEYWRRFPFSWEEAIDDFVAADISCVPRMEIDRLREWMAGLPAKPLAIVKDDRCGTSVGDGFDAALARAEVAEAERLKEKLERLRDWRKRLGTIEELDALLEEDKA